MRVDVVRAAALVPITWLASASPTDTPTTIGMRVPSRLSRSGKAVGEEIWRGEDRAVGDPDS
jgi:hypothetical protein